MTHLQSPPMIRGRRSWTLPMPVPTPAPTTFVDVATLLPPHSWRMLVAHLHRTLGEKVPPPHRPHARAPMAARCCPFLIVHAWMHPFATTFLGGTPVDKDGFTLVQSQRRWHRCNIERPHRPSVGPSGVHRTLLQLPHLRPRSRALQPPVAVLPLSQHIAPSTKLQSTSLPFWLGLTLGKGTPTSPCALPRWLHFVKHGVEMFMLHGPGDLRPPGVQAPH